MAFHISAKENVEEGVRRIVAEQIDRAISEIDDAELDRHEAVHQVRKRCKKIRGVLRLVRPALGDRFSVENAWFRDAASELSHLRDAEALVETFDSLMGRFKKQVDPKVFAPVRAGLTKRRQKMAEDEVGIEEKLGEFRRRMSEARERLEEWKLSGEGFEAIEPGLLKTYRRGREAMRRAQEDPSAENYHEWRKRTKYHWYHGRLLGAMWKPVMRKVRSEVKLLSDCLGDDHNFAVLRATLLESPEEFGDEREIQTLLGLIDRRSAELRVKAGELGRRVYAEKPKQLGKRFRAYWEAWRKEAKKPSAKLRRRSAAVTA